MSDATTRLNAALEGRYRIERELGEGGMATVYLAEDLKHERRVALKVLKPELAAVVGAERFLAEIKTTANLQHPHILPLHDSGEAGGFLFYVMPYIEGETLRDRLEREKQLPVDEAVRIATDVAEALQSAHEQGVIHRDVKPANILLSKGRPLVADFGIALAVAQAGGGRLTETGLSMGTPFYMSPEQASADREPSPASDVYSLGCVLYEMLVGEPPYVGGSAQAVLAKILTEHARAPTAVRPSIPANVDAAIRRALEKLPADRFTEAQDFAKALADPGFRHGEAGASAGAAGVWRRLSVGLAAVSLVLAGALGWSLLRPRERPVSRYVIEMPVTQDADGFGSNVALSPDGTQMVYVGPGDDGTQLWHRPRDQLRATPLPGTDGANDPVFSPDGRRVAFERADGSISVVSLAGEPPLTILDDRGLWLGLAWGSAGYVWGSLPEGLGRVPASGGEMELVTAIDTARDETVHGWPHVLPDGRHVLFTVAHTPVTDVTQYDIAVADVETGEHEVLVRGVFARYAPSGHLVYVTSEGTLLGAPFDPDALTLGSPVALAEGLGVRFEGSVHFALADDGTFVYQAGPARAGRGQHEFAWITRAGVAEPVQPGWSFDPGAEANSGWRLSPDGSRLVFKQEVQGNNDIWTKVLPDGPESRLTFGAAVDRMPRWAPDGQTITFTSDRGESGESHVWSKRADGVGEAEVLYDDQAIALGFWSPDGEWLILRRAGPAGSEGARDILAMRPGVDSAAIPLVADDRFREQGPAISPDGRWLAYSSDESGRSEVYVRPFPDVSAGRSQVSTSGGIKPLWAHSGRELFFVEPGAGALLAATVETGGSTFVVRARETLFTLPEGTVIGQNSDFYDVTADDQRFLIVRPYADDSGDTPTEMIVVENFLEELKRLVPN